MSESEDAARYRWLTAQFELKSEAREREVFVSQSGSHRTYETRTDCWHIYELMDAWRFGEHTQSEDATPFDALIDRLMEDFPVQP